MNRALLLFLVLISLTLITCDILSSDSTETIRNVFFGVKVNAESTALHPDGGYVYSGIVRESWGSVNSYRIYLRKESIKGKEQWTRIYPYPANYKEVNIIRTQSDNFVIASMYHPDSDSESNQWDFLVLSVDKEGKKLWETTLDYRSWDHLTSITQLPNGNFAIGGFASEDPHKKNPFFAILNAKGNVLFDKIFEGDDDQVVNSVMALKGNILLAGQITKHDSDSTIAYVLAVNEKGSIQWERYFRKKTKQSLNTGISTSDGVILAGSSAEQYSHSWTKHCWIVRLTASGEIVWDTTLEGLEAKDIIMTNEKDYVLVGDSYHERRVDFPGQDVFVASIDHEGNEIWSEHFDQTRLDHGKTIIQMNDHSFRAFGVTVRLDTRDHQEIMIIKINK